MKQISILLCLRYLQHRKIVLLSIAAVALSCALLITTDSLFTGFIDAIGDNEGRHRGDIILSVPSNVAITDYDTLNDSLEQAECISGATAVLESQGLLLSAPGRVRAVQVWGVELPRRLKVSPINEWLVFQKNLPRDQIGFAVQDTPDAIGGILGIGTLVSPDEVTDEYDVEAVRNMLGQQMALTTGTLKRDAGNENSSPQFSRKVIKFNLADVVMTGWHDFDESFILLPIEALSAKMHPNQPPSANLIHIRLKPDTDEEKAVSIVRGIWNHFAEDRFPWGHLASVSLARDLNARLMAEYQKQMRILLGIFILISGGIIILVFCIFYLIVMTRRKDIGILKSCGLSSGAVAGMFMLFGTIVGFLGAVGGIGAGYLIIRNINEIEHAIAGVTGVKLWKASTYWFTQIPNTMHWDSVLWITAAGVIAAAIGSLIPAIAAARVHPVETLQYE